MKLENFMVKIMIFLFGGNLIWKFALIGDFLAVFLASIKRFQKPPNLNKSNYLGTIKRRHHKIQ
jgi:hypothetical protein